jgi:replicative superfamily II helicase
MVDFKKLRASKAKPNPVPPREIFHSLPKPEGINDLYASQAEVLDTWHGRRTDRDVVVKLHTGGGKTLVALLMAQSITAPVDNLALRIAGAERKAFRQQRMGQYEQALATLEQLIDDSEVSSDAERTAWLSASAARIAHQMGEDARGQRLQTNAFSVNNNHCPPKQRPQYRPRPIPGRQSDAIVKRLLQYERRAALLADFEVALADLVPHASPRRYEAALASLGSYLGFDSDRPEQNHRVGPDVLWRTDAKFDFIIEAKNEKQEDNPLYKKDHAQLLEAEHWFHTTYPGRASVRVSALPEPVADEKATPAGTFALRLADATRLAGAAREMLTELVAASGDEAALRERCEELLRKANLKPDAIKTSFLKPFT